MIDINRTTKSFSSAPQESISKQEGPTAMSADEAAKLFGKDGNLGEYLNKLTDPNHLGKPRIQGKGKNELGKDDFLKLMLAQMKNQDPTNPLKSHEMAAQMAQFTSVEQLTNINAGIEALQHSGQNSNGGGSYGALSFLGKVASGDSSKLFRSQGDKGHEFNFNLLNDAMDVKVEVKDAEGNVVRTLDVKDLKKGKNAIKWNGITEDGLSAREGDYHFTVEAKSSNGSKVHAETKFEGRISGVKFSPQGPILLMGQQAVAMRDIQQIIDPDLLPTAQDQKKPLDLKGNDKIAQNESVKEVRAQAPKGNITDVPMARGLLNKIEKAIK